MPTKQPLANRIVIAFTALTIAVSGLLSLSIVAVVHWVEENIVSEELGKQLSHVIERHRAGQSVPEFGGSARLYAPGLPFPDHLPTHLAHKLKNVRPGFTEIETEPQAYYVFRRDADGQPFILVREQDEFEARENALFVIVFIGFLFSVLLAWGIGRLTARRVIDPVVYLANRVQQIDLNIPQQKKLSQDFPEDEVGQLASAFDNAMSRLQGALERERLFTSDVSHELRTPLMIIASSCELLLTFSPPQREKQHVERIHRATLDMIDLVRTFLLLARAESGSATATHTATLTEIAREQAAHWGEHIRAKGLRFELHLDDAQNPRQYDPTLLRAVISNLLRNALHYTEQGEVRLKTDATGFCVEDSGIGIPDAHKESMFNPFVRGTHARGEGLGLGLSLVKRICEQAGWEITLEDLSPSGTRFRIRLTR